MCQQIPHKNPICKNKKFGVEIVIPILFLDYYLSQNLGWLYYYRETSIKSLDDQLNHVAESFLLFLLMVSL